MSQFESSQIRNIAIVGHGDAGKTTFVSGLLFTAGATKRFLKVDDGNTIPDFDEDEIKRKISISTALCSIVWKKTKINILDTPGYSDFICDAFPALRSADIAVFIVNSTSGFECNLERLWESEKDIPTSRLFLINKLDRENTSFDETVSNIKNYISNKIIPLALPIGKDTAFTGFIDLLERKALYFESNESGKIKSIEDIPENMADQVDQARVMLIEAIAEADDVILEKYLEGEELSTEELKGVLKTALREGLLYPAIPISALRNIGASFFLDFCTHYLPSPSDLPPIEVNDQIITPDSSEPLAAQVFKTIIDPYAGKISVFRVYSGVLRTDSTCFNSSQKEQEKITNLFFLQGKNQTQTTTVIAGDIAATAKLKVTRTGDTLCDTDRIVMMNPIDYPDTLMAMAFLPASKSDEEKISVSLTRLAEEDPTLRYERNSETNQLIVSGMGQLHLEVTQDRLKRKFGVNAIVQPPKIPYRETVKGTADIRYRHKKQTGGAGQFGEVAIKLSPLPRGEGFAFINRIVGGVIPAQFIPSVEKGIRNTMDGGIIAGYKVTDIQVELYDGKSHPVDSKDIAFQIAGAMALKQAFQAAKPILLEPIMKIKVTVPETNMGDVIGDLNSKRGKVLGMEAKGKKQVIIAQAPMAELLKYEPELRSMTGGRGSFSMEFDHYEELPANLAEAVIAASRKE